MEKDDFVIGKEFYVVRRYGHGRWRCTDIGTRVITAICLDDDEFYRSMYNGPPYVVVEHVFDEYDMEGCVEEI